MLPWRCPDAAKQGRAVLAGPRESESALSVVGVACLRTPDPMTTRCSPAHCLGWVIRSDTMLRVSKGVFALDPSYDQGPRWVQWVAQRARLVACYGILYPAVLVPAAWVARQPLIAPELLAQIQDFFAEDWHRCQAYARQQPGASSSVGGDAPTSPAPRQAGRGGPEGRGGRRRGPAAAARGTGAVQRAGGRV